MSKSVLMVVTNTDKIDADHPTGLWLSEFAEPYVEFKKNNIEVTVVSPKGGGIPLDPNSLEGEQPSEWKEAEEKLLQTEQLSSVVFDHFDGVFLPGGHGTMFDLPNEPHLQDGLAHFAENNKVIGAVCHGPAGFVDVELSDGTFLVKNKKMTAFTDEEEKETGLDSFMPFLLQSKLEEQGAHFVAQGNWADHVVKDGKFITGQNPQSSQKTAEAFVQALGK
ncbi:type 1 glutamine amidotransferase domain-containing protein [Jeotgalibacillus sp. S-D1]|uniref:type 1 glutamine amidotransferase domain-containing protein n=1 Tax=Jeotgalibacillus sp. S-D1 TaxID=2552189 RepID=UPI00105988DA|nr:type 1 glutamine amidotransferase domain-containing protein [Jeotgalibacillus sp. S-D1]TDL30632.1 type 1 glutamine amidotransferase domain-containing protein [Jeotgalibacillus sp. S-D1]